VRYAHCITAAKDSYSRSLLKPASPVEQLAKWLNAMQPLHQPSPVARACCIVCMLPSNKVCTVLELALRGTLRVAHACTVKLFATHPAQDTLVIEHVLPLLPAGHCQRLQPPQLWLAAPIQQRTAAAARPAGAEPHKSQDLRWPRRLLHTTAGRHAVTKGWR
jgi:hypothetical protein